MDGSGAVRGQALQIAAFDQVDDQSAQADLDDVRPHAEHDGPAASNGRSPGVGEPFDVLTGEH